jgi:rare lipoprotein A
MKHAPRLFAALRWLLFAALAVLLVACGTLAPPPAPMVVAEPPPVTAKPEVVIAPPVVPPVVPPVTRPAPAPHERADAVPRVEPIPAGAPNRPYAIRGELYVPENRDVPMREVGIASWYGAPFHGRKASNGERYDMNAMTAAHPTMPLPSYARVKNLANGREVVVRVIDRGPFRKGRVIDLSRAAARKLRLNGLGMVEVERLTHDDIRTGAWRERRDAEREAAQARSRGGEALAAQ